MVGDITQVQLEVFTGPASLMLSVLTVTALAQGLKVSPWSYRNYRNKLAVVLGDYKTDPDAELERPERISLVDAATAELKIMELDYSSRWLGRGPHD